MTKTDEAISEIEQLESEVLENIGENPCRVFKVEFPYQVRITIPYDGHKTEVIINTTSEQVHFARNSKEVHYQNLLSQKHSKESLTTYIKGFVIDELYNSEPENEHLTFTGKSVVSEMTDTELETFKLELLSANGRR